ncbi:Nucleoporin nup35 [Apophysomyces ossiformis]|uniref:Nucleoporin nup35 n=1 Tax=Apophysomyces ossiformis TaxID=679940 RepID=A0A8H7ESW5_9FUNG|nr:Nucleoporin nup35 [Apophysomyces ossiformis]
MFSHPSITQAKGSPRSTSSLFLPVTTTTSLYNVQPIALPEQQQQSKVQDPTVQKQVSFGETHASYFSVKPGDGSRLSKPPCFFVGSNQQSTPPLLASTSITEEQRRPSSSSAFDTKQSILPGFLSGSSSEQTNAKRQNDSHVDADPGKPSQKHESTTVNIFGILPNMIPDALLHLSKYGDIVEHHQTPGNWISVRYASSEAARNAVNSNGVIIGQNHMLGVVLAPSDHGEPKMNVSVIRSGKDLYKKLDVSKPKTIELGSGEAGVSVLGRPSVRPAGVVEKAKDVGIIHKVKETLFGW